MFCIYTLKQTFPPISLKVKVMGSKPGYLLKSFYFKMVIWFLIKRLPYFSNFTLSSYMSESWASIEGLRNSLKLTPVSTTLTGFPLPISTSPPFWFSNLAKPSGLPFEGALKFSTLAPTYRIILTLMCGSCHFDRSLNDEFSVECLFLIFSANMKIGSESSTKL